MKIIIMKIKLFSIGLLCSLFTLSAFGQSADQFSIGPRIGVNISNVSNVDNTDALIGLVAGLTSTYSFSETSGVTVDILYSGEGYSVNDNDIKLNYLSIPIYYDVFFGELGQALRPKVYVGVVPAFLLSAKNQNDVDIKDSANSFNFAVSGGLGANYRLASRVWLNADLRAMLGLTDIRADEFQDDDNVASRNIQISLGVAYGISRID